MISIIKFVYVLHNYVCKSNGKLFELTKYQSCGATDSSLKFGTVNQNLATSAAIRLYLCDISLSMWHCCGVAVAVCSCQILIEL